MLQRALHLIVRFLLWLICRINVSGRENIPENGPFLVVANHLSWVDPPLVLAAIPARFKLTGMAAMDHRSDFVVGWLMDLWGVVWVRRGESDREALRAALNTMATGRPFGVAPEGTRSKTGALIEGKTGITFLALKADVPLVPVALSGTEKATSSLKRLRRVPVQVDIGPPFALPPQGGGSRREHMQYCTDLIMTRLASLLPVPYRGVYTDHPLIAYWESLDASGESTHPE